MQRVKEQMPPAQDGNEHLRPPSSGLCHLGLKLPSMPWKFFQHILTDMVLKQP